MSAFAAGFLLLIIVSIVLQDDGYIPKHSVLELQKAWPGSEVRWVTGGHVSSFFTMVNLEGLLSTALIDYRGRSLHCDRDIAQVQEIFLHEDIVFPIVFDTCCLCCSLNTCWMIPVPLSLKKKKIGGCKM